MGLPEAPRDSHWTFPGSIALPAFTKAQEHGEYSRFPEGGSFSLLKTGMKERTKNEENITINGENPVPCWQGYFVSHGYFLLNTELL